LELDAVVHDYNPSTPEVEVGGFQVWGQPGLHNEFEASLYYIVKPCLKQTIKPKMCERTQLPPSPTILHQPSLRRSQDWETAEWREILELMQVANENKCHWETKQVKPCMHPRPSHTKQKLSAIGHQWPSQSMPSSTCPGFC
jgi:hypothetical protein